MGKFSCSDCTGFCCINPPSLKLEEVSLFKPLCDELGVSLVATKLPNGYLTISLPRKGNFCCFFNNGECSIFNNRPQACCNVGCKLLDLNSLDEDLSFLEPNAGLFKSPKGFSYEFLPDDILPKVKFLPYERFVNEVAGISIDDYFREFKSLLVSLDKVFR